MHFKIASAFAGIFGAREWRIDPAGDKDHFAAFIWFENCFDGAVINTFAVFICAIRSGACCIGIGKYLVDIGLGDFTFFDSLQYVIGVNKLLSHTLSIAFSGEGWPGVTVL